MMLKKRILFAITFIFFASMFWIRIALPQSKLTLGPYISNVTQTSITISWQTKTPTGSMVDYGVTPFYGLVFEDLTLRKDHSAVLTGLLPSTVYHYRVVLYGTGRDYSFHTAVQPGKPFTFVVYGDTRTNHDIHTAILTLIQQERPLFAIHTGDLVSSGSEDNWKKYFKILCKNTTLGQTIPVFSTIGNHENKSPSYYIDLHLPHNNPESNQLYYSFVYGNSHFICINTTIDYDSASPQYKWLVSDLAQAKAEKFRFVFMHNPVYSSGHHGGSKKIRKILSPLFEKHKVHIVFSEHDHDYERTKPINGVTYIVTAGGGAPLYDFQSENTWTAYKEKTHHFCKLLVDSATCKLYMIRLDGAVRDSLTVSTAN